MISSNSEINDFKLKDTIDKDYATSPIVTVTGRAKASEFNEIFIFITNQYNYNPVSN